jgi:hypothetical protein
MRNDTLRNFILLWFTDLMTRFGSRYRVGCITWHFRFTLGLRDFGAHLVSRLGSSALYTLHNWSFMGLPVLGLDILDVLEWKY